MRYKGEAPPTTTAHLEAPSDSAMAVSAPISQLPAGGLVDYACVRTSILSLSARKNDCLGHS